ncbi:TRAP transporter substrate-binding protein [Propionivibrio dicarboxylicus]|uniref:TRAP-type C4-dicarboxylate transport system, substrate-binding protein n=1 Tax=Propionivibrio dicarboxylicus TaxID=83767 RepID=A0A1G8K2M0_9RHOO|nr:TRAP transporter substrate-binding protein [Propionivibrio dicarboxylicus]SDI37617.1 TRAP-type C4-dicarboxylate transport system, substrate-binding protein [Propionivibrio dicarboxylicus]
MCKQRLRSTFAALAMAVMAAPGLAQVVELKMSHYLPSVNVISADFLGAWAAEVEKRAGGKAKITIYPAGSSFGQIDRQLDQVKSGVVDIAFGLVGVPRDRLPRTELVELPFLAPDRSTANKALWAVAKKDLEKEYPGLKLLALTVDMTYLHTKGRAVKSIDDLKGLRVRAPSVTVNKILADIGSVPVNMPPVQVYESLEKGVIDGTVFAWDPIASYRLAEVLDNHVDNVVSAVSFWFAMNEKKYNALPPEVRAAIDAVSGDNLIPRFDAWFEKWSKAGVDAAKARRSSIVKLPDAEVARWKKNSEKVIEDRLVELEGRGVKDARAVYQDMQAAMQAASKK